MITFPHISWIEGLPLAYEFEIPEASPSNNTIKGMHFQTYKTLRGMFRIKVFKAALGGVRPERVIDKCALVIERHAVRELDWDNVYGGMKPIFDCLVEKSKSSPDGLGLVANDDPQHMPFPPIIFQLKVSTKAEERTLIKIYEIP